MLKGLKAVFERPLILGLYLIIVKNYKTIIVPNNSLNPAHPIAVAQAKLLKGATACCLRLTVATYWGMLFQVFRLIYLCLRRVREGFAAGAAVRIRLF